MLHKSALAHYCGPFVLAQSPWTGLSRTRSPPYWVWSQSEHSSIRGQDTASKFNLVNQFSLFLFLFEDFAVGLLHPNCVFHILTAWVWKRRAKLKLFGRNIISKFKLKVTVCSVKCTCVCVSFSCEAVKEQVEELVTLQVCVFQILFRTRQSIAFCFNSVSSLDLGSQSRTQHGNTLAYRLLIMAAG